MRDVVGETPAERRVAGGDGDRGAPVDRGHVHVAAGDEADQVSVGRDLGVEQRCIEVGSRGDPTPVAVDTVPGAVAVDGRSVARWAEQAITDVTDGSAREPLSPSQVDLAWRTVTVAIGRPDPLP